MVHACMWYFDSNSNPLIQPIMQLALYLYYPPFQTHTLQAKTAALNLYGADHFFTLRAAELLTHSQLELDIAHMCIQ